MDSTYRAFNVIEAGIVKPSKCIVGGLTLIAEAADCFVLLYDNDSQESGNLIAGVHLDISVEGLSKHIELPDVQAFNGVVADLTGTGAVAIVYLK